jgi:hypothetical protein
MRVGLVRGRRGRGSRRSGIVREELFMAMLDIRRFESDGLPESAAAEKGMGLA